MNDEKLLEKAEHRRLAIALNGRVWTLLEMSKRTQRQDEEMVYQAYASCFHWLYAGTVVHHQRGEWLISHVYAALGRSEPALVHARRCLELTESNMDAMEDFDIAFAYQGLAQALDCSGEQAEASRYYKLALRAGEQINDSEDRKIFFDTLGREE